MYFYFECFWVLVCCRRGFLFWGVVWYGVEVIDMVMCEVWKVGKAGNTLCFDLCVL